MFRRIRVIPRQTIQTVRRWSHSSSALLCVLLLVPVAAHAQSGSPFDSGFTNLQTLFTGTVAKVASLIAIVIGGYGFAPGGPGGKKALPDLAARTGISALSPHTLRFPSVI